MRDAFVRRVTEIAVADPRLIVITADLGFKLFDDFQARCPGRFLNVGVAEANMVSVAAGLALAGKRPFTYSIAPFATARCLEQIRDDVCGMDLPVVVVGVGGGFSYGPNGSTHHGVDDVAIMRSLPGMTVVVPCDPRETESALQALVELGRPAYLRLGRSKEPLLPGTGDSFALGVPTPLRDGRDVALLACGPIASEALQAADQLSLRGVQAAVLSAHTVKPLGSLLKCVSRFDHIFVIEEHGPCGGLYEALSGEILESGTYRGSLVRMSAPDRFYRFVGSSGFLRHASGLDSEAIVSRVMTTLEQRHR